MMDHRDYYRKLAAEVSDKDVQNAIHALAAHIGKNNPITRQQLAQAVYGKFTSSTDRKARIIIALLPSQYRIAAASNSGKAGYYICEDDKERMDAISYLRAEKSSIEARINGLEASKVPVLVEAIPVQSTLFGGAL